MNDTDRPNRRRRLARWSAAGIAVLALAGATAAGVTSASAPPDSPAPGPAAPTTSPCDAVFAGGSTDSMAPAESMAPGSTDGTMAAGTTAADSSTAPDAAGPFLQTAATEYGTILVDADCRAVYAFLNDTAGEPTCTEGCAAAWPPLVVPDETVPGLASGLDPALFSVVAHPADGPMLKAGDWPLYLFANDVAPGDLNGQGANDVWWLVGPDGAPVTGSAGDSTPATTTAG